MALIKGIDVVLYDRTKAGEDPFGRPVYEETPVTVSNVLVSPMSSDAIINAYTISGKHAVYELCIPKGDSHVWEDRKVSFFGKEWHTLGFTEKLIEENVPLEWNMKVKVERYG